MIKRSLNRFCSTTNNGVTVILAHTASVGWKHCCITNTLILFIPQVEFEKRDSDFTGAGPELVTSRQNSINQTSSDPVEEMDGPCHVDGKRAILRLYTM